MIAVMDLSWCCVVRPVPVRLASLKFRILRVRSTAAAVDDASEAQPLVHADSSRQTYGDDQDEDEDHYDEPESTPSFMRTLIIALPLAAVIGAIAVVTWAAIENQNVDQTQRFEDAVTGSAVMGHLTALQEATERYPNGSRSILTGYVAGAEYVERQLRGTKYFTLKRQNFTALVWEQQTPASLELGLAGVGSTSWITVPTAIPLEASNDAEACALRYSGVTTSPLTVTTVYVPGGGCQKENFTAALNKAALVLSNFSQGCDYYQVAMAAQNAGAVALLVARPTQGLTLPASRVRDADWTAESENVDIPCLGISFSLGEQLRAQPNAAIRLTVEAEITSTETFNLIAEVAGSDRENEVVVVGAHLDSVPEGPGMNDNGSGSACVLEMALQFAQLNLSPLRTTQFVWWGAEEVGLLGSRHYVNSLSETELGNISANLNFDMLASPNFIRMVYNSNGCPEGIKSACRLLQNFFTEYFDKNDLVYQLQQFSTTGGSDYYPFIRAHIPAGSIATGAGSIKSPEQRNHYGGLANVPLDPCYHKACDTIANVDVTALDQMTRAAAFATINTVNYDGNIR